MSKPSYVTVLNTALAPLGFHRQSLSGKKNDKEWMRDRDVFSDWVGLQYNPTAGVTANLATKDLVSEGILKQASPAGWYPWYPNERRIGHLMGTGDKWWSQDPEGPWELSGAVVKYIEPFVEQYRTLDQQIARYRRSSDQVAHCYLIVALYRQGDTAEACSMAKRMSQGGQGSWWSVFARLHDYFAAAPPWEARS